MRRRSGIVAVVLATLVWAYAVPLTAQQTPLQPIRESGQTVTPVFEGWYRNADGSFSLSFGYFNRNSKEVVEIPLGPNNRIDVAGREQPQPTSFQPRRHWGVFAVRVPADFGDRKVTWTLAMQGETAAIAGSLKPGWQIDALEGEAGSGNTPPVLKFDATGPEGRGPGGLWGPALTAVTDTPLTLTLWASDDGKAHGSVAGEGRHSVPVTLTWFKHQGPGAVTFADATPALDGAGGKATTTATFAVPGEYVLRVRANDSSGVISGGHAQCCWTNAFVKVTVTR